jgi:sugar O-acyltransferase (sialic acid O-acetyltransferase NeuD family)
MSNTNHRDVYVLGGQGHGRVAIDVLISNHLKVFGILDPNLERGARVLGVPVLGNDNFLVGVSPEKVLLINGMGANPGVFRRTQLFNDMKKKGFKFKTIQHATVVMGSACYFDEGAQVMAGAVLQNQIKVGMNAVINTRASVDHDCRIARHAVVSPGSILCGEVLIQEAAFIGAGAMILPGVAVGKYAIVGAGSVVTKDVPDGWVVAGSPAVRIGMNQHERLEESCCS